VSERLQRILWGMVGVCTVLLSLATGYVYRQSQRAAADGRGGRYRLVYVAGDGQAYHLYSSNLEGTDSRTLFDIEDTELFPVSEPGARATSGDARLAVLRLDSTSGNSGAAGVGTPGGVYVTSVRGSDVVKVSGALERIMTVGPTWSPDGTQLAFAAVEDLNGDGQFGEDETGLYVSEVAEGRVRRITIAPFPDWFSMSWSPAGSWAIISGRQAGALAPEAFLVDLEGGHVQSHPTIQQISMACWSPDGQLIAAYSIADKQVHIMDVEGNEAYSIPIAVGDVLELAWTADAGNPGNTAGRLFAITGFGYSIGAGPLYTHSAAQDSNEPWLNMTGGTTYAAAEVPSPDGRYVAFTLFTGRSYGDLYVAEVGRGEPWPVATTYEFSGMPTWVPGTR